MNQEIKKSSSPLWLALVLVIGGALGAFFFLNKGVKPSATVKPLPKAASVQDIKWDVVYGSMIDRITASLKENMNLITSSKGVESVVNFVIGLDIPQQFNGNFTIDSTVRTSFKTLNSEVKGKIGFKGATSQEPVVSFDGGLEGALISTDNEVFVKLDNANINIEGKDIQPMQTAMIQGMLSGFLSQYGNKWIRINLSGMDYATTTNIDPTSFVKFIYGFFEELRNKPILVVEDEKLLDNKKEFILALSAQNINSLIDYIVNDPVGKQIISSSGQPVTDEDIQQIKDDIQKFVEESNWRGKAIVDVNYNYEIILPLYSWTGSGDITGSVLKVYPNKAEVLLNEPDAKGQITWEVKGGKNVIKGDIKGKDAEGKEINLLSLDGNIDYRVKGKSVVTKGYLKVNFVAPPQENMVLEFKLNEEDTYTDKEIKIQIPTEFVDIEEILGGLGGFNVGPGMGPTDYEMNPAMPGDMMDEGGDIQMEIMPGDMNGEGLTPEQLQQLQQQFAQ